jgi:pilus assembly protein Flp/PilA
MACKGGIGTISHRGGRRHSREHTMGRLVLSFAANESGATAIEYSLIAAGIALAIVAVVNGLGTNVRVPFATVQTSLK